MKSMLKMKKQLKTESEKEEDGWMDKIVGVFVFPLEMLLNVNLLFR